MDLVSIWIKKALDELTISKHDRVGLYGVCERVEAGLMFLPGLGLFLGSLSAFTLRC